LKLLFDQNLSPFLCDSLSDVFPQSAHVRQIGLRDADTPAEDRLGARRKLLDRIDREAAARQRG
jgi:hypothetical protein